MRSGTSASCPPEGRSARHHRVRQEHGIDVGGGLGPGKGMLWRIGAMGHEASSEDLDRLPAALSALPQAKVV